MNKDQQEALKKLVNFLNHILLYDTHNYFLLNGAGGCGKTYTISKFLQLVKKDYPGIKYKILAPTHKACGVLKNSLKYTNVDTVAKFLNYKEEIDENGVKTVQYKYIPGPEKLLIIDECSMINTEEVNQLISTKISIIFIGDTCQVNPVKETISRVFKIDFYDRCELTVNERSTNKKVTDVVSKYRENVKKGYLQACSVNNECRIFSRELFDKKLFDSFLSNEDSVFIAWTNKQVDNYNSKIRKVMFGEAGDYVVGERIIFDKFYNGINKRFYTSQCGIISKCKKVTLNFYNPKCVCENLDIPIDEIINNYDIEPKKIKKCEKCYTPTSFEDHKKIEFWEIMLEGHSEEVFLKPVNGMSSLYNVIYKYKERCKMKMDKILWANYYKMLDFLNAPISYSYSITVHKSQGSGYDNVFVDFENINMCQVNDDKLKLLYTAMSRTKNNLYFVKPESGK